MPETVVAANGSTFQIVFSGLGVTPSSYAWRVAVHNAAGTQVLEKNDTNEASDFTNNDTAGTVTVKFNPSAASAELSGTGTYDVQLWGSAGTERLTNPYSAKLTLTNVPAFPIPA